MNIFERKHFLPCKSLLSIAIILLSLSCFSQTKEIDLLHQKADAATGKEQIALYNEAASAARTIDADTSLFFSRKAYNLSIAKNDEPGKMMSAHALGRALSMKGEYELAKKYFNEVIDLATRQKSDSMLASGYSGLGTSEWQLGKHAEALENDFKSLQIRENINDQKGMIVSNINISMVYQSQEKMPLAERYINVALALLKKDPDPSLKLGALHTLANILGMQGRINEALQADAEGIALSERTQNDFSKAQFYDNMANCYLYGTPPDYDKAFEFFNKTLEIDSAFSNKKQMSDSYANLGSLFLTQQKYSAAIPYINRAVLLAKESGFEQGLQKGYALLADAYKSSGQPDKAFDALQESIKVKDSLFNSSNEAKMMEIQTLYETVKKEQKIEQQHNRIRLQNFLFIGIAGIALMVGLLIHSQYKRYKLRQETKLKTELFNQQELATRAIIEAEENERQRIAKDLHDGVGQMMSAAKMNLSAFESGIKFNSPDQQHTFSKIIDLVDESCREVRHVSHNMMPNALLKNNLAAAVQDFTDKLDSTNLKVHLYTEGLDKRLDANVEIVLYRVIQECVNNVIKHANASTLDISIIKDGNGIDATVEDNGKGFDATDKEKFEGIGLRNIITRIEYLKGTVDFDAAPGRGTVVALHVPLGS